MSGYTWLCSRLLFPLHETLKGHRTVALRESLEKSQWWTPAQLDEYRLAKLRQFLKHCAERVPYYRDLFHERGFEPADITSLSDLRKLPVLDKSTIRLRQQDLISETAGLLKRHGTGGSSGTPLVFLIGKDRIDHDVAAKWRATRWWGVDIGDRELVFWGSPIELTAQDHLKALRDFILRTRLIPTSELSEVALDRAIEKVKHIRPRMLFGYPYAISQIAARAEAQGHRLDNLGIKVIFVTAEQLYDHQRVTIQRVFGAPVANGYGGRDSGFIAHQCPQGSLHISEDIIVEVVDESGAPVAPGRSGEIITTHLATKDFPFIRYRTGDVGVLDDGVCLCGRGLSIIKTVEGRSNDFVVARDGTLMHSSVLNHIFRDLGGIQQFKVVQESLELTRVQIIPGPDYSDSLLAEIERKFKIRLGQRVNIEIEKTTEIPPEASGKYRYIISRVATG
jgi:phenylacetate-CoA ligase